MLRKLKYIILWYIVRSYMPVVIPELVVNKDLKTVQEIAAALDRDWKEMLRDCIPKILVHILPLFAASKLGETGEDEQVKRRTSKATACYDLLTREISKEVFWARHEIVILTTYGPRHEKTWLCCGGTTKAHQPVHLHSVISTLCYSLSVVYNNLPHARFQHSS